MCRPCQAKGYVTLAVEVDHIVPRSQGGTSADHNLQPVCKACHDEKTAREAGAGRQAVMGRPGPGRWGR